MRLPLLAHAALPIPYLLSILLPTAAVAVDGVIEINQTCAVETGCTPSDAPGFPVDLDSGSYRLTSSLDNADPDTDVIFVGSRVHLDLNGFTVSGGRDGISNSSGPIGTPGQVIRNGSVEEAALVGVRLSGTAIVEDLVVRNNQDAGIFVGAGSRVTGCVVSNNQGGGIGGFSNVIVSDNVVTGNAVAGIQVLGGIGGVGNSVLRDNTLADNPDIGIAVPSGSVLRGNVVSGSEVGIQAGDEVSMLGDRVTDSDTDGITCGAACDLEAVSASGSGSSGFVLGEASNLRDCVARSNGDDGIQLAEGSRVSGCTVVGNVDDGIQAAGAAGVILQDNSVFGNGFGLFLDATTAFGDNTVSGSATAELFGASGLPIACNAVGGVVSCPSP